jgi:hypothetical protein
MRVVESFTRDLLQRASLSKLRPVPNSVARLWLTASLACVLLLLSSSAPTQTSVGSRASVPFDFWGGRASVCGGRLCFR